MADAPERIRVAQDADGFWTCREAVSGSQEYVRADLYAALEAQLAARTGGVKVEVLVDGLLDLRDLIMRGKRCVTDSGPAVKPVIELAVVHILDDAATALEALSPAPEAQQEPVAWQWLDAAVYRRNVPADANPSEWRPLYPRPAVTASPEMVKAMARWLCRRELLDPDYNDGAGDGPNWRKFIDDARAALKAAMEARE